MGKPRIDLFKELGDYFNPNIEGAKRPPLVVKTKPKKKKS
jgi:hypothetical protein